MINSSAQRLAALHMSHPSRCPALAERNTGERPSGYGESTARWLTKSRDAGGIVYDGLGNSVMDMSIHGSSGKLVARCCGPHAPCPEKAASVLL